MFLICHATSQDHLIEGACKFMGANSLWYVTTLIILVTLSIVIVEIFLKFNTCLKAHVNLWVEGSHGKSLPYHV